MCFPRFSSSGPVIYVEERQLTGSGGTNMAYPKVYVEMASLSHLVRDGHLATLTQYMVTRTCNETNLVMLVEVLKEALLLGCFYSDFVGRNESREDCEK